MYYAPPVPHARMVSSSLTYTLPSSFSYCVEFDYHMYSSDNTMGSLEVKIVSSFANTVGDFRITGNQGNTWHRAKFESFNWFLLFTTGTNVSCFTTNQIVEVKKTV